MASETERYLAYAEAQANHPDPQLQSLLALIYGPSLERLGDAVTQEAAGSAIRGTYAAPTQAK